MTESQFRESFALATRLAAKATPELIGDDERHLAAIGCSLQDTIAELDERLTALRRSPARSGQAALDRDNEVHRLTARRRLLNSFGLDLCLGRMLIADDPEPRYIGRLGLTAQDGTRLLIDWRAPAAAPFFAATLADPRGLVSRRRYRWTAGRVTDYWDEVFASDTLNRPAAPDDQSAFVAELGASRSARMRDVLATIAADQDAIIRASSSGPHVVDGGPGTGKTVVALHRAAYLLYADSRIDESHGGILFIGPHRPYLDYVSDVLPGLGEASVRLCTLSDMTPKRVHFRTESDQNVAALKSSAELVAAIEPAVRLYEEPPDTTVGVDVADDTGEYAVSIRPDDWAEAFAAVDGIPHNEARPAIRDELIDLIVERVLAGRFDEDGADLPDDELRAALRRDRRLTTTLERAWPLLDPAHLVADLFSVPAYLHRCAPWLSRDEVRCLQRDDPAAWTRSDLPLLDAARRRLGDPQYEARTRRNDDATAARRATMAAIVDDLLAADHDGEGTVEMLRGGDLREALVDAPEVATAPADRLAGPFAHVVVDEAQELTDAEWQMVLARCPSRSITVVGDRAQAREGFAESWAERLRRVGLGDAEVSRLGVNYRTPAEVMDAAEPVIRAAVPDANVPTSIRRTGVAVQYGTRSDLDAVLGAWESEHAEGVACVVGDNSFAPAGRIRSLDPLSVKGLEFDLVVLVDPDSFGADVRGAVDRYVAMTRTTGRLVVLSRG